MKSRRTYPVEVLWCPNPTGGRSNRWSFPPAVEKLILAECKGKSVLHFFGGLAGFGVRMDVDQLVKPDVIADAWMPPFGRDTFDVVVLDPPYVRLNAYMKAALMRNAAWIARERIIWFHTLWSGTYGGVVNQRAWLVRVGDNCYCRCLQFFKVREPKKPPYTKFIRGPAIKYNRWLVQPQGLPFGEGCAETFSVVP